MMQNKWYKIGPGYYRNDFYNVEIVKNEKTTYCQTFGRSGQYHKPHWYLFLGKAPKCYYEKYFNITGRTKHDGWVFENNRDIDQSVEDAKSAKELKQFVEDVFTKTDNLHKDIYNDWMKIMERNNAAM